MVILHNVLLLLVLRPAFGSSDEMEEKKVAKSAAVTFE